MFCIWQLAYFGSIHFGNSFFFFVFSIYIDIYGPFGIAQHFAYTLPVLFHTWDKGSEEIGGGRLGAWQAYEYRCRARQMPAVVPP